MTNTTPLVEKARTLQNKFLIHILRLPSMPVEELYMEYALYVLKNEKSKTWKVPNSVLVYEHSMYKEI